MPRLDKNIIVVLETGEKYAKKTPVLITGFMAAYSTEAAGREMIPPSQRHSFFRRDRHLGPTGKTKQRKQSISHISFMMLSQGSVPASQPGTPQPGDEYQDINIQLQYNQISLKTAY